MRFTLYGRLSKQVLSSFQELFQTRFGDLRPARHLLQFDDGANHGLIIESVNNERGVWGCDTMFRCIDACPKDVRPTDAIVGLRKEIVKHRFKKLLGKTKDEA